LVGLGAKLKEKIEVPKTGWSAIMEDTEGNVFVIWKPMKDFHQQ
jgi:predicted enzyme related to lactoylglutathione lyase